MIITSSFNIIHQVFHIFVWNESGLRGKRGKIGIKLLKPVVNRSDYYIL